MKGRLGKQWDQIIDAGFAVDSEDPFFWWTIEEEGEKAVSPRFLADAEWDRIIEQAFKVDKEDPFFWWTIEEGGQKAIHPRYLGGPGSGNFGHAGRPGEVGGSSSGVGGVHLSEAERRMSREQLTERLEKDPKFFDSLVRAGDSPAGYSYVFFARDIMDVHLHGYPGTEKVALGTRFKNPLFAKSREEVSQHLFGKNILPKEKAQVGQYGETEKQLFEADQKFADAARAKDYDVIVWPNEVQVLDKSAIPPLKELTFDEEEGNWKVANGDTWYVGQGIDEYIDRELGKRRGLGGPGSGNFGHAGRPGEVGGSASSATASSEANVAHKKSGGDVRLMNQGQGSWWNPKQVKDTLHTDESPAQIAARMYDALPGDVQLKVVSKGDEVRFSAVAGEMLVEQDFIRHNDGTLEAHLDYIHLQTQQGKGVGKQILADTMDEYQKLGVSTVTLDANITVGPYAWAKFGFKAERPRIYADTLKLKVSQMGYDNQMSPEAVTALKTLIEEHKNDPKLPWHVAGASYNGDQVGKRLMMDTWWSGKLDLNDSEAMSRFNAYVRKK